MIQYLGPWTMGDVSYEQGGWDYPEISYLINNVDGRNPAPVVDGLSYYNPMTYSAWKLPFIVTSWCKNGLSISTGHQPRSQHPQHLRRPRRASRTGEVFDQRWRRHQQWTKPTSPATWTIYGLSSLFNIKHSLIWCIKTWIGDWIMNQFLEGIKLPGWRQNGTRNHQDREGLNKTSKPAFVRWQSGRSTRFGDDDPHPMSNRHLQNSDSMRLSKSSLGTLISTGVSFIFDWLNLPFVDATCYELVMSQKTSREVWNMNSCPMGEECLRTWTSQKSR